MQGFGRWGFVLGNVLVAFGAPVFVTSLVATVAARRAGTAAGGEDVAAIVAGSIFMIAGLVLTVVAGRQRQVPPPPVQWTPHLEARPEPRPEPRPAGPIEPLPLTLNTLDDYYARSDGGLALADDEPYHVARPVPRPRNSRGWVSGDRFCEPSVTGTRSTGTRPRPQGG